MYTSAISCPGLPRYSKMFSLHPRIWSSSLERPEVTDLDELGADLLADLTHDGLMPALTELDRSTERAVAHDVLHRVRHL